MSIPELLPCPFCNSPAKHNDGGNSTFGRLWWSVWCDECCIQFLDHEVWDSENPGMLDERYPPQECFERWNRRA